MAGPGETFAYFLTEEPSTTELDGPVVSDDRIAVVRGTAPDAQTYYASALLVGALPSCLYVVAAEGGTTVATEALGAVQLEPAAPLAAYTVVMPPNALDNQSFGISSTQNILALLASPAVGQSVLGGTVGVLAANGGVSWRYRAANTTWYRSG